MLDRRVPIGSMTAGDATRHCTEKTVVSRIMAGDTTRYSALDTTFGLSCHRTQGNSKTNCCDRQTCNVSHELPKLSSRNTTIEMILVSNEA
jgi:hypothetical protein